MTRAASVLMLAALAEIAHGESARETAEKHYRLARTLHEAGKYVAAAEEYLRSYEVEPEPELLFNAGQAYRLGGQVARALEYYTRYLALDPNGRGATEAREHVAALRAELVDAARAKLDKPDERLVDAPKPTPDRAAPKPPPLQPPIPDLRPRIAEASVLRPEPVRVVVDEGSTAGTVLGFSLKLTAVAGVIGGVWMIGTGIEELENESPDRPDPAAERRFKRYVGGGAGVILGSIVTYYVGRRVSGWSKKKTLTLVPVAVGDRAGVGIRGAF